MSMQNQINPQYLPNQAYGQQPVYSVPQYVQTQGMPSASVGAVNIQIFNPTANAPQQGFYQPVACNPYPCNYNNNFTPQPMPSAPVQQNQNPYMDQSMNFNNNQNGVAADSNVKETPDEKKADDKKKDKPKIPLTDDYVRTLENYLNSQDRKVRLMGATELLERFKEDETRKDDAALTALLNKVLQDNAETVKFVGLTALDAGYATGNDETVQILTQMQSSNSSYGEDASLATRILLKMSGYKAISDTNAQNSSVDSSTSSSNASLTPEVQNINQAANNQTIPEDMQNQTPVASMNQSINYMPDGSIDAQQNATPTNGQAVA